MDQIAMKQDGYNVSGAGQSRAQQLEVQSPILRTSEHQLWSAVLLLALEDVTEPVTSQSGPGAGSIARYHAKRAATRWLLSAAVDVGSARWICDVLDLPYHIVTRIARRAQH